MRKLLLAFICIIPFVMYQCSQQTENPVSSVQDSKSVTISIATMDGFDTIAKYAEVIVSAKDMETIWQSLTITKNSITGTVKNIPVGKARFFEVNVYDGNSKVPIYSGSAYADIKLGEITYVTIVLKKLSGGVAVINGTIEDNPVQCQKIYMDGIKYKVEKTDVQNKIIYVNFITYAKTDCGGKVEYSWIVYGIDEKITTLEWNEYYQNVVFNLPFDGKVQLIALARSVIQPKLMTSDTLNLRIEAGKITDISNPQDSCNQILIKEVTMALSGITDGKEITVPLSAVVNASCDDQIEYQWDFSVDGYSRTYFFATEYRILDLKIPRTCYVKGNASVRFLTKPGMVNHYSFGFSFKDGKLVDIYQITVIDKIPLSVAK